ncbi:MAG TPA: hypothetical protein VM889_05225 [Candidatus Thermoplasmatota archaeon]|nr:hypothetical protein [Candidatus Thermoplasmatota archaeon]
MAPRTLAVGLLLVLLAAPLAGCVSLTPAKVPQNLLGGNGWRLDTGRSDDAPRSEAFGLAARQSLVYVDEGRSPRGYPGQILLLTLKGLLTPSDESIKDQVRTQVLEGAAAAGIAVGAQSREGRRALASGATSTFFTYDGVVRGGGGVFTTSKAEVKILGEVWHCRQTGTSVLAVALAQVSDVDAVGGVELPANRDATTWREIVADPSGALDGTGNGLVYAVTCA